MDNYKFEMAVSKEHADACAVKCAGEVQSESLQSILLNTHEALSDLESIVDKIKADLIGCAAVDKNTCQIPKCVMDAAIMNRSRIVRLIREYGDISSAIGR